MMNDRKFPTQVVLVVLTLAGVLILGSCTGSRPKAEQAQEENAEPKLAEVTISITGMT